MKHTYTQTVNCGWKTFIYFMLHPQNDFDGCSKTYVEFQQQKKKKIENEETTYENNFS